MGGLYSERLLEHFRNPRQVGELGPPALRVDVTNPACGDRLVLTALVADGRAAEARYKVQGCTAAIAAGSALAEWLTGRPLEEAAAVTAAQVAELVGGLRPESGHAAVLCVDAARALVAAARSGG